MAGFIPEWWPASNRNAGRLHVGIPGRLEPESAALGAAERPLAARIALPLVGAMDTVFATLLFGRASGTELFFVPCLLLAVCAFSPVERRRVRMLVAVLFLTFVVVHEVVDAGGGPWTAAQATQVREMNILAVASLSAFVAWRFSGTR